MHVEEARFQAADRDDDHVDEPCRHCSVAVASRYFPVCMRLPALLTSEENGPVLIRDRSAPSSHIPFFSRDSQNETVHSDRRITRSESNILRTAVRCFKGKLNMKLREYAYQPRLTTVNPSQSVTFNFSKLTSRRQ